MQWFNISWPWDQIQANHWPEASACYQPDPLKTNLNLGTIKSQLTCWGGRARSKAQVWRTCSRKGARVQIPPPAPLFFQWHHMTMKRRATIARMKNGLTSRIFRRQGLFYENDELNHHRSCIQVPDTANAACRTEGILNFLLEGGLHFCPC